MSLIESFPPVASLDAQVLILGSMPGQLSLEKQQYYAHTRNSFWSIMGELFSFPITTPYEERLEILRRNRIALWDVIGSCSRPGSLDSNIDNSSLQSNNIAAFITTHPQIGAVFFNGAKAEQAYQRHVAPGFAKGGEKLICRRLPSTSPAHAGMSREQKLTAWQIVREYAVTVPRGEESV
jgi:TDG/mug DNA glycosylase family protein